MCNIPPGKVVLFLLWKKIQEELGHLLPDYVRRLVLVGLWDSNDGFFLENVNVGSLYAQMENS